MVRSETAQPGMPSTSVETAGAGISSGGGNRVEQELVAAFGERYLEIMCHSRGTASLDADADASDYIADVPGAAALLEFLGINVNVRGLFCNSLTPERDLLEVMRRRPRALSESDELAVWESFFFAGGDGASSSPILGSGSALTPGTGAQPSSGLQTKVSNLCEAQARTRSGTAPLVGRSQMVMIGDSAVDRECSVQFGCKFVEIVGVGNKKRPPFPDSSQCFADCLGLLEALRRWIGDRPRVRGVCGRVPMGCNILRRVCAREQESCSCSSPHG